MLSQEQIECLDLMVNTRATQKSIAKKIKVTEQTICNWKKDPEFISEYNKMVRASLRSVATKATRTLVSLLKAESEQVRLNAAKDILDRAGLKPETKLEVNGDMNGTVTINIELEDDDDQ